MRQRRSPAFRDPIQAFQTPVAIRLISETVDSESAELEGRIQKIYDSSNEPIGDKPETTSLYIDQRAQLVEDIEEHRKKARKVAREAYAKLFLPPGPERDELKSALTVLEHTDGMLLKERAALAANRIRVQYHVLGRPSNVKIGKAYKMAITDNVPERARGPSAKKTRGRPWADLTSFSNRLIKAYIAEGSKLTERLDLYDYDGHVPIWCPISGKEFPSALMKATQIIPYSIGETNASYLFGSGPHEGYEVVWSEKNGLMMNSVFETKFDDGRMVVMPDPSDEGEFISIILCQDLLKDMCPAINAPYRTIHRRRLQFQTAARPDKRYLYMHALLTLFQRRRDNIPGWEKDREQVFGGQTWALPKNWARKSMMEVLALEIGDSSGNIEGVEGLGDFPDAVPPEEEKRMATLVRYGWETRASSAVNPDNEWEEDEDDSSDDEYDEYDEDEEDDEDEGDDEDWDDE
jgi:hypothetical protein